MNIPNKTMVDYQQFYILQTFHTISKFNAQNTLYFSESKESWNISFHTYFFIEFPEEKCENDNVTFVINLQLTLYSFRT